MIRERLKAADERVAIRFTRTMRASTSRWGMVTDPPLVCIVDACILVPSVLLYRTGALTPPALPLVYALLALPVIVAVVVHFGLGGARRRVVGWLAEQPFAIENFNGLLNGVGQNLLIRFVDRPPNRNQLNEVLERLHSDCFALDYAADEPEVEVRIGVLDSKLNPARTNFRRFARVKALVEQSLVPLSDDYPIAWVRVS